MSMLSVANKQDSGRKCTLQLLHHNDDRWARNVVIDFEMAEPIETSRGRFEAKLREALEAVGEWLVGILKGVGKLIWGLFCVCAFFGGMCWIITDGLPLIWGLVKAVLA